VWLIQSLTDFSQSEAKTKVDCSQHSKETTAGSFNFLHMGSVTMSDVLPCYKGSVWLILDMPCPLGTVACQKVTGVQSH
jgi:hypothetical protein